MFQLIVLIIFIVSFFGIVFILKNKIPFLIRLPENGYNGIKKPEFILSLEDRIKDFYFDFFKKKTFLHKFLSWVKILVLKIETKIDHLLHGIRKKSQELDKEVKIKRRRKKNN